MFEVEALARSILGDNLELLYQHTHMVFTQMVADWYLQHYRSRGGLTLESLKQALRDRFKDQRSDYDLRDQIRKRLQ